MASAGKAIPLMSNPPVLGEHGTQHQEHSSFASFQHGVHYPTNHSTWRGLSCAYVYSSLWLAEYRMGKASGTRANAPYDHCT